MTKGIVTKISRLFGRREDGASEEYEHCVLCGALTDIPVSAPVDQRENYESGVGQLCEKCAGSKE